MTNSIMNTYGRLDVAFEKGEGAWLIDDKGNRYLDALSGIAVCGLGHANPAVAKTLSEQGASLIHTSNIYRIPNQEKLADKLVAISDMDNVFFANSGAEANECAIKIARLHGHNKGLKNPSIIVSTDSFHGRTLATLSASGSRKVQAGFDPLVSGFIRAPFGDIDSINAIAGNNKDIVAVMVEPIQGEGGINVPDDNYLTELRRICDEHGWFLILDEVQTGNARTGKYFAYQHTDILPDIVTTAKGLGNGMPIGVCMARGEAAHVFKPGNHGSTYGGNPLACGVALTVVNEIEKNGIADHAAAMGERMMEGFSTRLAGLNCVKDIRGKGLMIGIELDAPCTDMTARALEKGLLINVTHDSVIRLLPPLIINEEEADRIVDVICELIEST